MPDFHREALEETRKMLLDRITRGPLSLEANDLCIAHNYLGVAERHARLLAAVWEIVKHFEPLPERELACPCQANDPDTAPCPKHNESHWECACGWVADGPNAMTAVQDHCTECKAYQESFRADMAEEVLAGTDKKLAHVRALLAQTEEK